jgi:hypothetical protein
MIPNVFKENYIRVYCKDKNKVEAVTTMFEKYKKMIKMTISNYKTPIKINNEKSLLSTKREREVELNKIN